MRAIILAALVAIAAPALAGEPVTRRSAALDKKAQTELTDFLRTADKVFPIQVKDVFEFNETNAGTGKGILCGSYRVYKEGVIHGNWQPFVWYETPGESHLLTKSSMRASAASYRVFWQDACGQAPDTGIRATKSDSGSLSFTNIPGK